jgi:polyferredoxin
MKRFYSLNFLTRFVFLLLTPVFFQYFALGFIWHSIYWGVITFVLMIWAGFIILSPLVGRIGCGWFCFMGTVTDFAGAHAFRVSKLKRPNLWLRLIPFIAFFATSITFYFLNKERGVTHNFEMIPDFISLNMDSHYKIVWVCDVLFAFLLALFLNKRWGCKNLCMMGLMCSTGAKYSRLLTVVDATKCTRCRKCENECLASIPIIEYIKRNGLVTNSECILCGKCAKVCKQQAIRIKFVKWRV